MADTKITDLAELAAAPAAADELVLVDTTMAATNKRINVSKFLKAPTLGEVAGDTLTVNAGIWTLGSNYVATRAAGALATGVVTLQTLTNTFSGDVGGATVGTGLGVGATASGANSFSQVRGLSVPTSLTTSAGTTTALYGTHYATSVDGAGSATSAYGNLNSVTLTSTGNVTNAYGVLSFFTLSGAGDVTTGIGFNASAPTLSSTGAITTNVGFNANNLGHASLVTNAFGFSHADFTGAATLTIGFRSLMSSGTGKWGFQHNGTANNAFAGPTRFGSVVAPTETVHVTGTLATSGIAAIGTTTSSTTTLNLPLGATGVSPLRIAHGVAPTSPVNGDIWTTTAGLFYQINGVTKGPDAYKLAASGASIADKGNLTSEETFVTVSVPANAMGANGSIRVITAWTVTSSANDKIVRVRLGGTELHQFLNATTGQITMVGHTVIQNRNATNSQVGIAGSGVGTSANSLLTAAIDTTASANLTITAQKETGTESMVLQRYSVEVIPSA